MNLVNCSSIYTSELFFSLTAFLHFPLLSLKNFCTTEKDISCILLDDDLFSQGLLLSGHMQQLPWECAVCLHTNRKHVVLRVDLFEARYFEKMPYRVPFLWC